jgi:HD-like signal output (HDOD) protein
MSQGVSDTVPSVGFECPPAGASEDGTRSRVVGRLKMLPSYHPTVVALLGISTEASSVVEDFERVFKQDPGFASELLKRANSAEFGLARQVESIRQALLLLGVERVSSLAFSLATQFYLNKAPSMRDVHAVWAHSLATAVIGEAIATTAGVPRTSAYTAGLVHDLGRLGLMMTEGHNYLTFTSESFQHSQDYLTKEAETVGMTHAEAGSVMAAAWGLPTLLCAATLQHHDVMGPPADTVAVVGYACRLATALGYAEVRYEVSETWEDVSKSLPEEMRGRPRLDPGRLRHEIARIIQIIGTAPKE